MKITNDELHGADQIAAGGAVGAVLSQLSARSKTSGVPTLDEVDALVGQHVIGDTPKVAWEYGDDQFRFESLDEAVESLRDPLIREFLPVCNMDRAQIKEVHEYPAYSSDFAQACRVIECLGHLKMTLASGEGGWVAQFGSYSAATAYSAPLAICLAALRVKNIVP